MKCKIILILVFLLCVNIFLVPQISAIEVEDIFTDDFSIVIKPRYFYSGIEMRSLEAFDATEDTYNSLSFEILGENSMTNELKDIKIVSIEPLEFKSMFKEVNTNLQAGEVDTLYETRLIEIDELGNAGDVIVLKIQIESTNPLNSEKLYAQSHLTIILGELPPENTNDFLITFIIISVVIFILLLITWIVIIKKNG